MELIQTLTLAVGLGLLGFVEPCSVGSHLLFVKYLESHSPRERLLQTTIFTLTRAGLMAGLGVLAASLGANLQGVQHGLWAALGGLYLLLGLIYLGGGAGWLIQQMNRILPKMPQSAGGATWARSSD